MSSTQLSFSLCVSSRVKSVHLLGSWDNYGDQLPLSKDKTSSKSGVWKGTFRFPPTTLVAGQRYWYYYILDGFNATHNPSQPSTVEPTTRRELNILDVPKTKSSSKSPSSSSSRSSSASSYKSSSSTYSSKSSSSSSSCKSSNSSSSSFSSASKSSSSSLSSSSSSFQTSRAARKPSSGSNKHTSKRGTALSVDIPKGRPLSASQIKAPKPMTPNATRRIIDVDFDESSVEQLSSHFASTGFYNNDDDSDVHVHDLPHDSQLVSGYSSCSPVSSDGSSLSYRSDNSSSPRSSLSGYSTPASDCSTCTCGRYGITRTGERVRIDCGGSHCGFDRGSQCSSDSGDDSPCSRPARRHGMVFRD